MKKKTIFAVILAFVMSFKGLMASTDGIKPMSALLKEMPDDVIPILTHINVLDFIDFLDSGSPAEVTNRMKGTSEMLELSESYALIQLTSESRVELKVLPYGPNDCLIYVVSSCMVDSLTDSSVKVYDSQWHLASASLQFSMPHVSYYNELHLSSDSDTLFLREVYRPLLFDGERRSDRPDEVVEYSYIWNVSDGKFKTIKE